MRALLLITCLCVVLTACSTMDNQAQHAQKAATWQGQPADALVKRLGSPNSIRPAANGNTLFVYNTQSSKSYPLPMSSNTTVIVGPKGQAIGAELPPPANAPTVPVFKCTTTFEIDKQHRVVSEESHGIDCQNSVPH